MRRQRWFVWKTLSAQTIDVERAKKAREFHQEVQACVESNQQIPEYNATHLVIPVVGSYQKTLQSGRWSKSGLEITADPIRTDKPLFADGDGTVPAISAIPLEMSDSLAEHIREREARLAWLVERAS